MKKTEEKLKHMSVRLPESLTHVLKVHAAQTQRSAQDFVRKAIEAALKAEGVKC